MDFLTEFAVEIRYPTSLASKRTAVAAMRWAKRIRTECRQFLGIPAGK
jgi:hypothetical protein